MVKYNIRSNYQSRPLVSWHDLSAQTQADFDYVHEEHYDEFRFFLYRGVWHDAYEFERLPSDELQRLLNKKRPLFWGFAADTYFSGVAIGLTQDNDRVYVARVWTS